jgi:hypothetical protein
VYIGRFRRTSYNNEENKIRKRNRKKAKNLSHFSTHSLKYFIISQFHKITGVFSDKLRKKEKMRAGTYVSAWGIVGTQ